MHVPDGILPLSFTLGGWACVAGLTALSLSRIAARPDPQEGLPRASMMTAVFFAASLIHIPIPPGSVHLMLSGLMGAMLGWYALPAILIGLTFQAVMFGHGGLTTLGLNGVILGLPALAAFGVTRALTKGPGSSARPVTQALVSFATGAGAVMLAVALFAAILLAGLPAHLDTGTERAAILALALGHIPLALTEGLIVVAVLGFLRRTSPEMIGAG